MKLVITTSSGERSSLGTTNGRTDIDTYNTRLSANYNMTPNDFLFSELKMSMTEYAAPLISSELYGADLYLNHGFTNQFVLGVGVEAGYNAVDFRLKSTVEALIAANPGLAVPGFGADSASANFADWPCRSLRRNIRD